MLPLHIHGVHLLTSYKQSNPHKTIDKLKKHTRKKNDDKLRVGACYCAAAPGTTQLWIIHN